MGLRATILGRILNQFNIQSRDPCADNIVRTSTLRVAPPSPGPRYARVKEASFSAVRPYIILEAAISQSGQGNVRRTAG